MARKAKVTMVNPSPRGKKRGKNMAKKRKKKSSKRRSSSPRRRRRNPAPRRRRRASASPARRRRRRNPAGGYRKLDFMEPLNDIVWRMAGMMMASFAIQRFAPQQGAQSVTAGSQMSFRGYLVGMLGGYLGSELIARWQGHEAGREAWRGAVDFLLFKAVWTEGFARSQWLNWAFGNAGNAGLYNATIQTSPDGTVWLMQPDGTAVSMQGYPHDPMGAVVPEDRLGFYDPDISDATDEWNMYQDSGSKDPYVAAYSTV